MPELPEVETVRRGLEKLVLGAQIENVEIYYPKIINGDPQSFQQELRGRTIESITRRGKYLIFNFDTGISFVSHLRMEGKYFVENPKTPLEKHTHIVFTLSDGQQLRYNDVRKFGRMHLVKTVQVQQLPGLKKLGPEPTAALFDKQLFYERLKHKKKMIKPALLDQTIVAGLGNIYTDEVLWSSKINPQTPAAHLSKSEADRLHDEIITELARATSQGGTTVFTYTDTFGHAGSFQKQLHAYGRKGQPCERCATPLKKIVVGQRGTTFCPQCQKVK
ncbi:DNA-formamidopyrimidine glycosylase [Liquorilactobacillus satsumensis]|uniref:DNA-formamidopyrimidine glycosylase n=1 Tax=Liquorilactobacillus satsumensis TaxID=259059 RepID=UPI0021C4A774|nr:DNA-formamidopyrimidine glycosylase [Liquorilactobacillus satsumensis]MCP9311890.1 DNA-formamidopyrimidine glycosylase [Liquorilactobacillus satsumensis]MCP9359023.1 DNA-formamidopyrimidine glycosylase [Liquorilactobacillus satsumensis]